MLSVETKELTLKNFKEKKLEIIEDKQRLISDCFYQKSVYEQ